VIWHDLAHDYHAAMTTQPMIGPPCIENVWTIGERPFNIQRLVLGTHLGTYALGELGGPGLVLPVHAGASQPITVRHLEAPGLTVERGDIVLLATGWDRKFSTPDYHTHPYLSDEAAAWLVERGVRMVGVDFFSADLPVPLRPPGFDWPVHHRLLGAGVLIAENLANLTRIGGRRLTIGAFPLKIRGGDGAPARIFGLEER